MEDAMKAQELMRAQFAQAHQVMESVVADCDEAALTKVVGGNIGTIGAIYAHAVFDEDGWIAGVTGEPKLWESGGWAEKTGLGEISAMQNPEWTQSTRYDVAKFREYAQAVYQQTDGYLANASDEELDREIEAFGRQTTVGKHVGAMGLWHVMSHQGEMAAVKGAQGLKGLPF
jgi:uncharacterized damage-inducible protein DinB